VSKKLRAGSVKLSLEAALSWQLFKNSQRGVWAAPFLVLGFLKIGISGR
jgi:hypothetical protein